MDGEPIPGGQSVFVDVLPPPEDEEWFRVRPEGMGDSSVVRLRPDGVVEMPAQTIGRHLLMFSYGNTSSRIGIVGKPTEITVQRNPSTQTFHVSVDREEIKRKAKARGYGK